MYKQLAKINSDFYAPPTNETDMFNNEFDNFLLQNNLTTSSMSALAVQLKEIEGKAYEKICSISAQERVSGADKKFDIFQYYREKFRLDRAMLETAVSILSVPSNQVSVERTFSGLKIVCSDRRMGLTPEIIDDIMVTRCNANLLSKIDFNSFKLEKK